MQRGDSSAAVAVALAVLAVCMTPATAPPPMDEEMAELAAMVRQSCLDETGADLALVEQVNAGTDIKTVPDPKLKCYMKCVMETAGVMTDGEVDVEAVLNMMPDEVKRATESAVRSCGTKHGADHCDNAYLTNACWQETNKPAYFLI